MLGLHCTAVASKDWVHAAQHSSRMAWVILLPQMTVAISCRQLPATCVQQVASALLITTHRWMPLLLLPVAQNTYGETHSHNTHEHRSTVGANHELGEVVAERPVAVGVAEVRASTCTGCQHSTICVLLRQYRA